MTYEQEPGHQDIPKPVQVGDTFGRLKVLAPAGIVEGHPHFLCRCDCGNLRIVRRSKLTTLHTTTCGEHRARRTRKEVWFKKQNGSWIVYTSTKEKNDYQKQRFA